MQLQVLVLAVVGLGDLCSEAVCLLSRKVMVKWIVALNREEKYSPKSSALFLRCGGGGRKLDIAS